MDYNRRTVLTGSKFTLNKILQDSIKVARRQVSVEAKYIKRVNNDVKDSPLHVPFWFDCKTYMKSQDEL